MLKIISSFYNFLFRLRGISIGANVRIGPSCFIGRGFLNGKKGNIIIRSNCELSQGVILKAYGGEISIKQNTFIGEYAVLYGHGGIEIGENTLIAMHTCIVSSNHTVPDQETLIRSQPDILMPVKIGNDVWIGAGAKILGGITIGDGCVIGAGAVVTKGLPPFAMAVGVPAKIIGYRQK